MKTTSYFAKANVSVDSSDGGIKSTLETGYKDGKKTFMYFPIKVMHKYYEDAEIRKACNIVKREEIELKKSIFPYNIKCPKEVGVAVTLTLNSDLSSTTELKTGSGSGAGAKTAGKTEVKESTKKRLRLFVCKTNTTLDAIIANLIEVKTWDIDGTTYKLERVVGPKDRVVVTIS